MIRKLKERRADQQNGRPPGRPRKPESSKMVYLKHQKSKRYFSRTKNLL